MIQHDTQAILAATDILALAGEYTRLQRCGRQWRGRCPFHQEKTASFYVDPTRGVWYCHGACHGGGNAIKLLQAAGMSYGDAIRSLAERAGLRTAGHWVSRGERDHRRTLRAEAEYFWFFRVAQAMLAVQPILDAARGNAPPDLAAEAERCVGVAYGLLSAVRRASDWDRIAVYADQPEPVKQANRAEMRQQPTPTWDEALRVFDVLLMLPAEARR